MPKTVTLSDDELAALQAMRQAVADARHPARPAAIAALDRIAATPEWEPRFPVHTRSGPQPLDVSEPDGYRCSMTEWRSDWPETDILIPPGQDLRLELRRPGSATSAAVLADRDWRRPQACAVPAELLGVHAAKVK